MRSPEDLTPAAAEVSHEEQRHAPAIAPVVDAAASGLHEHQDLVLAAHAGHDREDSKTAAASQQSAFALEALTQSGGSALPSARLRDATASEEAQRPAGAASTLVRRTDGVTAVAQPGSAPRFKVEEVVGSNPISGSVGGSIPPSVSTGAGCDSGDGERGLVPSQVGRREERSPSKPPRRAA